MYNILAIAKNKEASTAFHELIKQTANWRGQATDDLNEAEFLLSQEEFDVVLLTKALSLAEEQQLLDFLARLSYQPKVVRSCNDSGHLLPSCALRRVLVA